MSAIITVCRDDLGLPFVDPLHVYLYRNTASFAFYGYGWRTLPIDVARVAASADENKIYVNLGSTARGPWSTMLSLLAHEYGHNVHHSLSNGHLRGTTWFTEGFGDWLAAKVLDALGWVSYEVSLHRARREIAQHRDLVLGLSWLHDRRNWDSVWQKPKGYIRTYSLAFAAVDRLIAKKGLTSAIEYIKSGDFESSFGESQVAYKADLESPGQGFELPQNTNFSIRKPEWKIGDRWVYTRKILGTVTSVTRQLVSENNFRGLPLFVVKSENEEILYTKESLGLLVTMKAGMLVSTRDQPNRIVSWPLEAGKEWRNSYNVEDYERKVNSKIDRMMVVTNIEQIRVPAGNFETVKIEAYDNDTGRLESEYWYSPKAKWMVKFRSYASYEGFTEDELVSLNVH